MSSNLTASRIRSFLEGKGLNPTEVKLNEGTAGGVIINYENSGRFLSTENFLDEYPGFASWVDVDQFRRETARTYESPSSNPDSGGLANEQPETTTSTPAATGGSDSGNGLSSVLLVGLLLAGLTLWRILT
jgi:hypothetical protein